MSATRIGLSISPTFPNHGVGLARLEFIINRMIGVHPQALLEYDSLDDDTRNAVDDQMAGYENPVSFFVDRLAEGIATIAAAFAPMPLSCACPTSSPMSMLT